MELDRTGIEIWFPQRDVWERDAGLGEAST